LSQWEVSNNLSSSQNNQPPSGTNPIPTQKQNKALWPIVNSSYWILVIGDLTVMEHYWLRQVMI
jgi:hypothetical protein